MIIDIFDIHLTGVAGAVAGALAYWGCLGIAFDVSGWVSDRFEWDRPSWRPWTWRMYRRWFGPGQLVASEDFDEAREWRGTAPRADGGGRGGPVALRGVLNHGRIGQVATLCWNALGTWRDGRAGSAWLPSSRPIERGKAGFTALRV